MHFHFSHSQELFSALEARLKSHIFLTKHERIDRLTTTAVAEHFSESTDRESERFQPDERSDMLTGRAQTQQWTNAAWRQEYKHSPMTFVDYRGRMDGLSNPFPNISDRLIFGLMSSDAGMKRDQWRLVSCESFSVSHGFIATFKIRK